MESRESRKKYDAESGEVVVSGDKDGLVVATMDSAISVLEIQGENSKKMSISDYLRGNTIAVGDKFN